MGHTYPSKVDWWIGLVLLFSVLALIGSAVPFFVGPPPQTPLGLGIGVLCLAFAVWIGAIPFNTNYEIGQTKLVIRSGGIRWNVPLDSIMEVFPTHNPLSSPACSLDRLRVNYHNARGRTRFVLISPREKEAFLRDLAGAVAGLEWDDDRALRLRRHARP
jgi:hypothetical protein